MRSYVKELQSNGLGFSVKGGGGVTEVNLVKPKGWGLDTISWKSYEAQTPLAD